MFIEAVQLINEKENIEVEHWFSNTSMHENDLEDFKTQTLDPTPEFLIERYGMQLGNLYF